MAYGTRQQWPCHRMPATDLLGALALARLAPLCGSGRTFSLQPSKARIAGPLAPQPVPVLDVQPQRFLHLFQRLHRELCVVPVTQAFLNRSALMRDETLPFGNMSLRFYEMLRESSSFDVHNVSSKFHELEQDMCQVGDFASENRGSAVDRSANALSHRRPSARPRFPAGLRRARGCRSCARRASRREFASDTPRALRASARGR